MKKILIHPLGAIVESHATTYEELSVEFLGCSNYYFSSSPVGSRKFGSLPSSGEVYIRQQSTLKSAVEEMVTDDPIVVNVDEKGRGSIQLQMPIPRGCELVLREVHFSKKPKTNTFNLNGEGPITFKYVSPLNFHQGDEIGIGVLEHALPSFESVLVFSKIAHITKAVIHMVPCDTISAVEMFFPGTSNIQLTDYFKFTETPFRRFEDYSYRYNWNSQKKHLRSIELPSGFLNWHILVNSGESEILLNNKNGIAPVMIQADIFEIVLVPPHPLNVRTVQARLYYDEINTVSEVIQLQSQLRKAEREIKRLQQI